VSWRAVMLNANRSFGLWADLAVKRFKCGHEKTPDNSYKARVTSSGTQLMRCKFCHDLKRKK
jgi:hypothetical protein